MAFDPPNEFDCFQELRLYFKGPDLCYVEPVTKEDFEDPERIKIKLEYELKEVTHLCERPVKAIFTVAVSSESPVCTHWEYKKILGSWMRICTRWR